MSSQQDQHWALKVSGLSKEYPGTRALDDIAFFVAAGEIHGLVGENGAGKSTLIKSIAGAVAYDEGSIEIWGTAVRANSPHGSADAGVAIIYQELTVVPDLSAVANVLLGRTPTRMGFLRRDRARSIYLDAAAAVGADISPEARAGSLSTSAQQLLEVMRALVSGKRLIMMDEPTASLGPEDAERLHKVMRDLRDTGHSIVYVSHDLDAVLSVCDQVTVMREGAVVETRQSAEWTRSGLIKSMLGAVAPQPSPARSASPHHDEMLLEVSGVSGRGVSIRHLSVRRGEIVGVAGLVGSGRTRMLRALAGADRVSTGTMTLNGVRRPWPSSPQAALRLGIALAPEDRKHQGLVLSRSAAWNVALGSFRTAGRGRFSARRLAAWARPATDRVGLSAARLEEAVGTLSGGNQQKVVLARLLRRGATCLLLDEPTRGIDIGAKAQVFETIRCLADEGVGVVWCSSDLDEVVRYSDRVVVVARGGVVAGLDGHPSVEQVLTHCFAHTGTTQTLEEVS